MDLRIGLIVLFLILDVSFVWATDDKSSGGISLVIHVINGGDLQLFAVMKVIVDVVPQI